VHLSAIGADPAAASLYARSKGEGERAVRAAYPTATVLRPSVVFGAEDQFFQPVRRMRQLLPFMPGDIGATKFQPVYVGDVAERKVMACSPAPIRPAPIRPARSSNSAAPRVWRFRELLEFILKATHRNRAVRSGSPMALARLQAAVLETHRARQAADPRTSCCCWGATIVVSGAPPAWPSSGSRPTPVRAGGTGAAAAVPARPAASSNLLPQATGADSGGRIAGRDFICHASLLGLGYRRRPRCGERTDAYMRDDTAIGGDSGSEHDAPYHDCLAALVLLRRHRPRPDTARLTAAPAPADAANAGSTRRPARLLPTVMQATPGKPPGGGRRSPR